MKTTTRSLPAGSRSTSTTGSAENGAIKVAPELVYERDEQLLLRGAAGKDCGLHSCHVNHFVEIFDDLRVENMPWRSILLWGFVRRTTDLP